MADEKVKILDIQVKYEKAIKAMADYRQSITNANKAIEELKQDLADGKVTQDEYNKRVEASRVLVNEQKDAIRTLTRQVQNQIKEQKEQDGSLKQLRSSLSLATAAYDSLSRAEREGAKGQDLKRKINELTAEIKGAEFETQRFYRNVGNYKDAQVALTNIKTGFMGIASTISGMVLGGGIMAFGKQITDIGRNFDDAMARVRAVTNATTEDMKIMKDEAQRLGSTTAYTAQAAAEATEVLARAGLSAQEAANALQPTLFFDQANSVKDLAASAEIMVGVSNSYRLGVEGMTHVSDIMSQTASIAATDVSLLGESFKNVGSYAGTIGVSLEETSASLAALADVNVKGADAGTALRMTLLGLASPSSKAQAVFKQLGVEINQQTIKSEGLTATLRKLVDAGLMKANNSAELLTEIFGRKAAGAAASLLSNVDKVEDKLSKLGDSEGRTAEMFDKSMSTVSNQMAGISSAWESLLYTIYESNSDGLVTPLDALRETIIWIKENLPAIGRLIMSIIASVTFLKLVSGAKAAFLEMRNSAVTNAEAADMRVKELEEQQLALRKQVATLTTQAESASASEREKIESRLSAKKRELAEQDKLVSKATNAQKLAWEKASALETGTAWQKTYMTAKTAMLGFFSATKAAMKSFAMMALISAIIEGVMWLWDTLNQGEGVFANLKKWGETALNYIVFAVKSAINWFIELYNNSLLVRAGIQYIVFSFKTWWEVAKLVCNLIIDQFKGVANQAKAIGRIMKGIFTLSWTDVKGGFEDIGKNIRNTVKEGLGDIKKFGQNMANNFADAFNSTANGKIKPLQVDDPSGKPQPKTSKGNGKKPSGKPQPSNTQTPTTEEGGAEITTGGDKEAKKKAAAAEKARKARAEALKKEQQLVAEAEKAMLNLMGESAEQQRLVIVNKYDTEIKALQLRLTTEKNLTDTAKAAINTLIIAKEQEKQTALDKLSEDEIKKQTEREQKRIASALAIVQKGSQQELDLKKRQLDEKYKLDLAAMAAEQNAEQKGAASVLALRQQTLQELRDNGGAEEQIAAAEQAVTDAQSRITSAEEYWATMRADLYEKHRQDEQEAQREYDEAQFQNRQQVLQNEIDQITMANEEKLNANNERQDITDFHNLQESLDYQGLDVVTNGEMQKLELEKQMAQERYDFICQQGQLETETAAQFEARKIKAKQDTADAQTKINQANLKNEKAYTQSMKSLGDSLCNIIAQVGESNETFGRLSKMITLAKIAVDTGKAISAGVANAMEVPFPGNIAAVATTVATVMANITTALNTVKSANFAEGGHVYGPGTGTSDSVPANLSNGEFVMTAKATKMFEPMLIAMNSIGKGVPMQVAGSYERTGNADMLTQSFTAAVENIRPVVSVEDIAETQDRVSVIETLDNM